MLRTFTYSVMVVLCADKHQINLTDRVVPPNALFTLIPGTLGISVKLTTQSVGGASMAHTTCVVHSLSKGRISVLSWQHSITSTMAHNTTNTMTNSFFIGVQRYAINVNLCVKSKFIFDEILLNTKQMIKK